MYVIQKMQDGHHKGTESGERVSRMRSRQDEPTKAGVVSWRRRLLLVPRSARLVLLALLACAATPGAASLYGAFGGTTLAAVLREHRGALAFMALLVAGAVVVLVERPRSASPGAYARQLRDRVLEVQSSFDGALRRREGEGEEKSHAVPHAFDPNR
jgi:hypothetical protein